ncbi:hypothetical protein, partial [Micromonospora aurantiaca (nom. illeg.)]|uniref:hypothetical protein n=1 Tax=Micromonospora aurantiaca (nom. illeg.) TaxID=47850 RepID=UPI0033D01568
TLTSPTPPRSPHNIRPDPAMAVSYTTSADVTRGHHGTFLARHYARRVKPETPTCWIGGGDQGLQP